MTIELTDIWHVYYYFGSEDPKIGGRHPTKEEANRGAAYLFKRYTDPETKGCELVEMRHTEGSDEPFDAFATFGSGLGCVSMYVKEANWRDLCAMNAKVVATRLGIALKTHGKKSKRKKQLIDEIGAILQPRIEALQNKGKASMTPITSNMTTATAVTPASAMDSSSNSSSSSSSSAATTTTDTGGADAGQKQIADLPNFKKVPTLYGELITETQARVKYELSRSEIENALRNGELKFMERAFMGNYYIKMRETDVRALAERLYPGKLAKRDSDLAHKRKMTRMRSLKREISKMEKKLAKKKKELEDTTKEKTMTTTFGTSATTAKRKSTSRKRKSVAALLEVAEEFVPWKRAKTSSNDSAPVSYDFADGLDPFSLLIAPVKYD